MFNEAIVSGGGGGGNINLADYDEKITSSGANTVTITTQNKPRSIVILSQQAERYTCIYLYDEKTNTSKDGYQDNAGFHLFTDNLVQRITDTTYSFTTGSSTTSYYTAFVYY